MFRCSFLFVLLLLPVSALPASAPDLIDYRQAVYQAIGGHMSAIAGTLKGEAPFAAYLELHARGVAELAPLTRQLFPLNSSGAQSKARDRIWEDAALFRERRESFIEAAQALGSVGTADMPEYVSAFRTLAETCKACHDGFKRD